MHSYSGHWDQEVFKPMLKTAHRITALIVGIFIALHIVNHLVGLTGQQNHIDFMKIVRPIYRTGIVETCLVILLVWQMVSGIRLLVHRWRNNDGIVAWLQITSGAYLALFLIIHVSSVLFARSYLGIDTNFNFAAAGLHTPNGALFFAPYYAGSFVALSMHIGCATSWRFYSDNRKAQLRWITICSGVGCIIGILVVMSLGGILYDVKLPS